MDRLDHLQRCEKTSFRLRESKHQAITETLDDLAASAPDNRTHLTLVLSDQRSSKLITVTRCVLREPFKVREDNRYHLCRGIFY